ncbi:AAA family ATPase [Streptosporangium sp. NBC_01495]|uniref:AAA family ATPase n=1 Tax=Streptosporangium sp. NBC_01495 TaxID=2903899 RepID=UPI002E326A98|nr:AAA family ATPase [Streptosporangium sp. NBC_01495]
MRPHRLWITAFGSFPGEEQVDFDALTEAGLFLIHGPTGAGKTTVLDALCYALYGRVPGRRDSAKSLRCDHAPPGRGPSVALEVTVRGRRLKITRSPAWQRPKLRGTGTTRENEKALLQELAPSGEWVGLTTRVDEAGEFVGTLLGMNAEQFLQVAMLPQGDFAKFLRADGEERRKVLERLFSVKIYATAESWLAEQRTEAYREQQTLRQEVDFAVKRLEEAAGPVFLTALADLPEPGVSVEDDPLGWAHALEDLARLEAARLGGEGAEGEAAVRRARESLERGAALADRRRRHAEALTRSRALEETAEERADLETILEEAAAADRVLPLIQGAEQRAEAASKAHHLAADAVARALPLLGAPLDRWGAVRDRTGTARGGGDGGDGTAGAAHGGDVRGHVADGVYDDVRGHAGDGVHDDVRDDVRDHAADDVRDHTDAGADRRHAVLGHLVALERDRQSEITRLDELRAEESRLAGIVRERERTAREIAELTAEQAEVDTRLEVLPGLRRELDERLTAARLDAARVPAAESAVEGAATRLRAAEHRDRLAADLSAARADLAARLAAFPPEVREALPEGIRDDAPAEAHDALGALGAGIRHGSFGGDHSTLGAGFRRDGAEADPLVGPDEINEALDPGEIREVLTARERECGRELAGLEGLRVEETRLAELDGLIAALDTELPEVARQEAEVREILERLPAASAEASARLGEARAAAAGIPAARASTETAAAVLAAARRREILRVELESARAAQTEAVDLAQTLRDRHLDIRRSRIDGMAAELAAKLAPGHPCAVCGSPDHPAPAAPADRAPTADDERAAQGAYEAAMERRQAAGTTVTTLVSRLDEALAVAGDVTGEEAGEILAEAGRKLESLTSAASAEETLAAEVERIAAELDGARTRAAEIDRRLAEGHARRTGWQAERERLTARLDVARGTDPTVRARRDRLAREAAHLSSALTAATRALEVAAAHREASDRTGLAVRDAEGELTEAERALAALRESAGAETVLAAEAGRIAAEFERLGERSRELAVGLASRRTNVERLGADAERLAGRIDEARGQDPTLAARLDRLADEAALLREAVEAVRDERVTAAELVTARDRALGAVVEAGFFGLDDARAAFRSPTEREEKAARLRELAQEGAAVAAMLADPELVAAAAEPEPDLAGLRDARDAADAAHARLLSERDRGEARLARLAALRVELAACRRRWEPADERHRLTERLATLTGGNSTDNRWKMRLSSYVLGERLSQVVESANERLDHMSGGRYLLEHNRDRSAGDRSRSGGGLGLHILDSWTGVGRDPATLSGGESFITSLALALGLADVVSAEAGGVDLGTLFVDEGFGTLDEDTLDGVLDILDGLRDGGRAVGIVSHVAELRTRVPAQLHIRKERRGSTVRQ